MIKDVVKVYNDEPRAGTFFIAQGFGREHKKVVQLINKYKDMVRWKKGFPMAASKMQFCSGILKTELDKIKEI